MEPIDRNAHRFFISYRREDAAGHAGRLADHLLDRYGADSVFMDVESIQAGVDFTEAIERAIGDADAVLAVIGPGWLEAVGENGTRRLEEPGDLVRREVEAALASDTRVIPVLVGGAAMPAEERLPRSIAALARRNAIEIQDRRWRDDLDALIDVLESGGKAGAGNLPVQPTPFLGRQGELAEVVDLIHDQDVRLLTLTGPGGIGKTRLAVQAAGKLAHNYPGGAWFVALAPLTNPELVLAEAAHVLEVQEGGEGSLVDALASRLSRARTLLVLDNLEQLLPEAAAQVAELSAAAPPLDLIASSREPLHVAAEREYPVGTLSEEDAIGLFVERARVADAGPTIDESERQTVAAICARLDRLPLAIELAAARIRLLSPSELLERLEERLPLLTGGARDAPERQRTLRATIAWSYELLSEDERALFESVAIFSGGFTLDAAEAVCGVNLDTLQGLLERSLLRQQANTGAPRRYEMLETIREFALELLRNGGRDLELAPRHEGYFLSLALEAEPQLRGSDPRPWFDRLEIELSNLRAAIDSSLAQGRVVVSLRLVSAWARLWEHRGYWREGRAWLDAVLARSNTMRVTERAAALLAAGTLTGSEGETALSRSLLEQAVELARDMGDRRTLALALTTLAWVAVEHGVGVERSVALGDEGLAVARDLGDPWVLAESLSFLSSAYRGQSLARADALMEEGLKLRRSMGDAAGIADSLNNLGFAAITGEDYARAAAFLEESHELAVRLDDRPLIVLARDNLALIELFDGDLARAEELFRETLRLCWKIGDRRIGGEALIGLAGAAARRKEWDRAAWLAGASTGLAREGERRWNEAEARIDGRYLPDAREALGDRPYDTSFERGRAATFEEAVAFALEGDGGG